MHALLLIRLLGFCIKNIVSNIPQAALVLISAFNVITTSRPCAAISVSSERRHVRVRTRQCAACLFVYKHRTTLFVRAAANDRMSNSELTIDKYILEWKNKTKYSNIQTYVVDTLSFIVELYQTNQIFDSLTLSQYRIYQNYNNIIL